MYSHTSSHQVICMYIQIHRYSSMHTDSNFSFDSSMLFQLSRQSQVLKEQEVLLSEARQQNVVLEGQLETLHDETERLQANLSMYKLKYEQHNSQLQQMEATVSDLQEKLHNSHSRVSTNVLLY